MESIFIPVQLYMKIDQSGHKRFYTFDDEGNIYQVKVSPVCFSKNPEILEEK